MARLRLLMLCMLAALLALPGLAAAQGTGKLTGTVSYRQRISLPANAVLTMQLADVTANARTGTVLAEQRYQTNGQQVPLAFEINYDPTKIAAGGRYIIQGNISVDGVVRFTTATPYQVLTSGTATSGLQVVLVQVGATTLPGTSGVPWLPLVALTLAVLAGGAFLARQWAGRA